MAGLYVQWLQAPNSGDLADDAALNYITTITTISESTAILKHLTAQAKQVEKKQEKVLFSVESDNGCCVETLTTLKFRTGGGAFLPGMDSNMLDEREVTFPLTHVVNYTSGGKISQIRLYWDQGTVLKQVEAIGKSGRNWPIRDGDAQVAVVMTSVKTGGGQTAASNGKATGARGTDDVVIRDHHKRGESVSVTRDPHASLALFAERDPNDNGQTYSGPRYETAKSARPGPRDYGELFASAETAAAVGEKIRRKYFSGNRLFDAQQETDQPRSPERKKTYDKKYDHFAFGDGEDAPKESRPKSNRGKNQQGTKINFEDFSTPPKYVEKHRPDYERHWGAGVDQDDPLESPPKRPIVHAARKDAESHWEMTDKSPMPDKAKSLQRQKGMGLYQDSTVDDERSSMAQEHPQSANVSTNVNNSRRGDDFGAHYKLSDESPAGAKPPANKRGTRTELTSNWGHDSPKSEKKIYKTAGDGMGSRKGARSWGIGDDSDPEVPNDKEVRPSARSRRVQADAGAELDF